MQKLLACLGLIFYLGISYTVFAEEESTEARYYTGIGVSLWEVSEGVLGIGSEDGTINNEHGQITGRILTNLPLKDSSAAQAGMKSNDVILFVDGEDAQRLGTNAIIQKIRNGQVGEAVHFKIGRLNLQGEIERTIELSVTRERIDSVAWLFKDYWFSIAMWSNDGEIEAEYKLTEDTATQEFTYYYRITNRYKKKMFVRWATLDVLFFNTKTIVPLEPEETREFRLKTKLLPTQRDRSLCIFAVHDWLLDYFTKERKLELDGNKDLYLNNACMDVRAFIPRKYYIESK